ncbi:MAG TPA: 3-isopropylmalate dehydratase small subunit [Acidimicrobiales bacterium]|nr:3-isopropylmalate dehydratase small subunit [Acidimicrobiales bacterium]
MRAVAAVEGTAVPLGRSDVDTDQIIPAEWLKRVERTGFGRGLFGEWRDDPGFVLNDARYAGAAILIAGARFGIGSSREHAVWALLDYGFAAVVAESFGDIFKSNAAKSGLVTAELGPADVDELTAAVEADAGVHVLVDVERGRVEVPSIGWTRAFELDRFTRERLLHGWDDVGLTLRHEREIDAYESAHHPPSPAGRFDADGHLRA